MACTVDHLRAGHRVEVIRDFTDAKGVEHHAGETAVLVSLALDWEHQEICLTWEREARSEVLRFALSAKTGPRNGAMRDYFTMGEEVPEAGRAEANQAPSPTAAAGRAVPTEPKPRPPNPSLARFAGRQPPDDTCLNEVQVACDCDPALHQEVLLKRGDLAVMACLRCGTVTCTRSIGDDGRFTGDSWQAYRTVMLPERVLAWVADWPRVKATSRDEIRWPMAHELVRYDRLYLPAGTRCESPEALAKLESRLAREQASQSPGQRLRAAGFPRSAAPPELPAALRGYADIGRALALKADSPVRDLIELAQRRSAASDVAADLLNQRPDREALLLEALRSADPVWRSAGFAMALLSPPKDPHFADALIEILNGLSLAPLPDVPGRVVSCGRFEALLVLVAELKLATPAMLAALAKLQRQLARHDAWLVDCLRIVVRELRGEPPESLASRLAKGTLP